MLLLKHWFLLLRISLRDLWDKDGWRIFLGRSSFSIVRMRIELIIRNYPFMFDYNVL